MISVGEKDITARALAIRDEPWTTATLPPDSSQDAWLVSYIDVLMLLATLLVVLLTVHKGTPEKTVTATSTMHDMAQVQTNKDLTTPTIRYRPHAHPDRSGQQQETLAVTRLSQQHSLAKPSRMARPIIPRTLQTPEVTRQSIAPKTDSSSHESDPSKETVALTPARQAESASKTVQWNAPSDLQDQVEVVHEAESIRLEVNDTILFESGSADLKPQGMPLLAKLADMLKRHPGQLSVEGHTDDTPIATKSYPSNWELSAARASTVARSLITYGIAADRLRATGYAETRPRSTNDSEAGRARNRRVTLVMYPPQT